MKYFAKVDDNNVIENVIVLEDEVENGELFITETLKLDGRWLLTEAETGFRKQMASMRGTYDEKNDVFITPQPFPSWSLNESFDWEPPIPEPETPHYWDEETLNWVKFPMPPENPEE